MKEEKFVKNLIIGGGISGLSFAYYTDDDYSILEKDSEVGGYCRTIKNDRYVWDYAGHFYHFNSQEYKDLFLKLVEPEEIVEQKKVTKILYKDNLIDFPFQLNIHQLNKDDFCDCLYDLYMRQEKDNYYNFLDMLYGKYGKGIVERFLKPYNEKLYAVDLRELDKDAMGRFFPSADFDAVIKSIKKNISKSYNDNFLYLKKGAQYFINKLYDQLDKSKIHLNTEVTEVNTKDKYVITSDGQKISYENLINTTPLNNFLPLLGKKEYSDIQKSMSYNKILVLNIGFDSPSKKFDKEHWVYFPSKDLNFYRIGFYNNILGSNELSVYVEIGFPQDQDVNKINIEEQLQKTLDGMKKAGIIDDTNKLVDYSSVIMDPAYVHVSTATDAALKSVMSELESEHIFTIGRYGKWTYSSIEECVLWAKEISDRLA